MLTESGATCSTADTAPAEEHIFERKAGDLVASLDERDVQSRLDAAADR